MGRLWKQNYKIAAGKSPTLADEPGEVLTFGQGVAAVPSGDFVGGPGISVESSGNPGILIFSLTGGTVVNELTIFPSSPAFIATSDYFCVLNASGVANMTLPATPLIGQTHVVKDGAGDAGASTKTILPSAGTIDGGATATISANYGSLSFIYDGAEWKIF